MLRKLLCKMGWHKWEKYASQIFCLNQVNYGSSLQYSTKFFYKCSCGKTGTGWSDNFRDYRQDPRPASKPTYYSEEPK